jgi:tyrosinase
MANMDRRNFLLASLGGLGSLAAAGCADVPGALISPQGNPVLDINAAGIHVRRNIYCLGEGHADLIAYRAGVAAMKARPDSDPTSWQAQRAIHWTNIVPPTSIYNQCPHTSPFFLSWHRMYLYYFERIVRASSGNPSFALPYWGYSPTGARDLPLPFRSPASNTNTLYTSQRSLSANAGNPLNSSSVDSGAAMPILSFYPFQSSLESTPHNTVHNPGVGGWMASVPTAAQDPVFFLHHANIDRLWSVWLGQGGGRTNPTDSPWLNDPFPFYDENGNKVTLTGAEIVDTANQLCYLYASPACKSVAVSDDATLIAAMDSSAKAVWEPIGPRPPRTAPVDLSEAQVSVKLGGTPVTVRVPVSASGSQDLDAFPGAREGNRLVLELRDVRLEREPELYYEVYVNLATDARQAVYSSPHYAGNLSFFGVPLPGEHALHAAGGHVIRIDLLRVYAYLSSRGLWKNEEVQVTFVPRGSTEADDPARVVPDVQATVGRVTLQIR